MDIAYYFHRVIKNAAWPLCIAMAAAAVAYLLTQNQEEKFTSEMVVYPASNTNGDNFPLWTKSQEPGLSRAELVNLRQFCRSTDILEETALRLFAQHLVLQKPDSRVCFPETWLAMMSQVPDEIRQLVPLSEDTIGLTSDSLPQPGVLPDSSATLSTMADSTPVIYTVRAGDFPLLIAERYTLSLEELERFNHGKLDPIYGGQQLLVGYTPVPVITGVAKKPAKETGMIREDSITIIPDLADETITRLKAFIERNPDNYVTRTLSSDHPIYGIRRMGKIRVSPVRGSGFVRIGFGSPDPAVSMNTLQLFAVVCNSRSCKPGHLQLCIVESPLIPASPDPSNRPVFIIGAFLAGLLLTGLLIFLFGLFDPSIKYPGRFSRLSGLKILGVCPVIRNRHQRITKSYFRAERCLIQIAQRIRLIKTEQPLQKEIPFFLFLVSMRKQEGKTLIAAEIIKQMRRNGMKVLAIKPVGQDSDLSGLVKGPQLKEIWDFNYTVPEHLLNVRNLNELIQNYTLLTQGYDFVIIELPALIDHDYPASLVGSGGMSILISRASSRWTEPENEMLAFYRRAAAHPVYAILDRCYPVEI